jgi:hypothetical protein
MTPPVDVYVLGLIAGDMAIGTCSLMADASGVDAWAIGECLGMSEEERFCERSHILAQRDAVGMGLYNASMAHWVSPDPEVPPDHANFNLFAAIVPSMMHPDPAIRPATDAVARHFFHGALELSSEQRAHDQERVRQMLVRFCGSEAVWHGLVNARSTGNGAVWCFLTAPMRALKNLPGTIEENLIHQARGYVAANAEELAIRLNDECESVMAKLAQ